MPSVQCLATLCDIEPRFFVAKTKGVKVYFLTFTPVQLLYAIRLQPLQPLQPLQSSHVSEPF